MLERKPKVSDFDFWSTKVHREVLFWNEVDYDLVGWSWSHSRESFDAKKWNSVKTWFNGICSEGSLGRAKSNLKAPRKQPGSLNGLDLTVPITHFWLMLLFFERKNVHQSFLWKMLSFVSWRLSFFSETLQSIKKRTFSENHHFTWYISDHEQ